MSDEVLSQEEIEALIAQAGGAQDGAVDIQENSVPEQPVIQAVEPPAVNVEQPVRPAEFGFIKESPSGSSLSGVDLILDVQLQVTVELGRAHLTVKDVLGLGAGSVVELDKHAGEPVEVVVNNKTVARGEVVVIDENFGVRVTEIVKSDERVPRVKAA